MKSNHIIDSLSPISILAKTAKWLVLIVYMAIAIFPLIWLGISSFKTNLEIEISPFKSKVPAPRCKECGARLTSSGVGERVLELLAEKYPEETCKNLSENIMLCPECRRKKVGGVLSAPYAKVD